MVDLWWITWHIYYKQGFNSTLVSFSRQFFLCFNMFYRQHRPSTFWCMKLQIVVTSHLTFGTSKNAWNITRPSIKWWSNTGAILANLEPTSALSWLWSLIKSWEITYRQYSMSNWQSNIKINLLLCSALLFLWNSA